MSKEKIPKQDLDYVEAYAKALKKNPEYFKQQKILIESQLKISREIFRKKFGTGKNFTVNARKYLKNTERI